MAKSNPTLMAAFEEDEAAQAVEAPAPSKGKSKKSETKPARKNTVLVGGHFAPEVQKQLRMIAAEEGTTNQALLGEALNLLFRKKGKSIVV